MNRLVKGLAVLTCVSSASAQYYGGNANNYGYGYYGFSPYGGLNQAEINRRRDMVIAHAVLAAAAFVILFPAGAILIRFGSFRGAWLVHGIIQAIAFLSYIAAAGLGIYIARSLRVINHYHPIIGLVLLGLLAIQPFLGLAHHFLFRKHSRRMVWSYAHIWLGRIAITLGIINGGFGLQLARQTRFFSPGWGAVLLYSLIAGIVWLVYVICAIVGEIKRSRAQQHMARTKEVETVQVGSAPVQASDAASEPRYA